MENNSTSKGMINIAPEEIAELRRLFNLYNDRIYRLCFYITADEDKSKDIVSSAFFKLSRQLNQLKDTEWVYPFLAKTARNESYDHLRQEKQRREMLQTLAREENVDTYRLQSHHLEHEYLETTVLNEVYKEIEKLPKKCRAIFKLLFIDQRTPTEIAALLEISTKTVSSQKIRAINILRNRLVKKIEFIRYTAHVNKTEKIIKQINYEGKTEARRP